MQLVLIGYMGSGKSSVGKQLADKLKYQFADLDAQIEKEEGKAISELFSEEGQIYFRKKENETLKKLIKSNEKYIIATGGGTPCYGDTLDFLNSQESVLTIYLQTSLDELTKRLFSEKDHRPLIAHLKDENDLKDFIRKHLFERSFYYNQANITIVTDTASIEEIVEEIIANLF